MKKKVLISVLALLCLITLIIVIAIFNKPQDKLDAQPQVAQETPTSNPNPQDPNDPVKVNKAVTKNETEDKAIEISYPVFDGFEYSSLLNEIIVKDNEDWIKKANEIIGVSMLDKNYNYYRTKNLLSVVLYTSFYDGNLDSPTFIKTIIINVANGKIYEEKELFQKSDYKTKIDEIVIKKMNQSGNFEDEIKLETLKNAAYKFYFDKGMMQISFNSKDIGFYGNNPYYYSISKEEIKNILSKEIYDEL